MEGPLRISSISSATTGVATAALATAPAVAPAASEITSPSTSAATETARLVLTASPVSLDLVEAVICLGSRGL